MLNKFFDQVYVINLKSREDRRRKVIQKLARLEIDYTFFEAVNGYSKQNIKEFNDYVAKPVGEYGAHPLEVAYSKKLIDSPGAWGYLKTYINLLNDAKQNGYERILCFDDDILIHKDIHNKFEGFVKNVPRDWKLLYLGATQHTWNIPKTLRYPDESINGYDPDQSFYYPSLTDGSFAVGIDSSVYDMLISSSQAFNAPFDSGPLRDVNLEFPQKCFVAQPNLVIAEVTESDIREGRNQYELAEKVKWDMDLYDYPFKEDLVSVIIPVFNGEDTIEQSIRSVLNQSYPTLEIIVADDGSSDGTCAVVKKLQNEDNRIVLLENEENRGCYFVRNDALRVASGKYIAIQDADDVSVRHRIEKQIMPLIKGEALFTISNIIRSRCKMEELNFEDETELFNQVNRRRLKNKDDKFDYQDREILGFNSSVFQRSLFEDLGLFWEKRYAADAEFCERVLFNKGGIRLQDGENIHSFLMNCDSINGLYKRIDQVLVVSSQMEERNITNKYTNDLKKQFENEWRQKFEGHSDYSYPAYTEEELKQKNRSEGAENWEVKYKAMKEIFEIRLSAREQMVNASRKQMHELENGLAWYSRTYDHLPKWFLKIGSIFRRIKIGR